MAAHPAPRGSLLGIRLWRIVLLAFGYSLPPLYYLFVMRTPLPNTEPERLEPAAVARRYHQADEALHNGRIDDAVEMLERLRKADPYNALIHGELGLAYHKADRLADALAATRLALGLDPSLEEARFNLGALLSRAGRVDDALRTLSPLVDSDLDLRALGREDPDLDALRRDIRFRVFLAGADTIVLHTRAATLRPSESPLVPGEPFELVLEVLTLEAPGDEVPRVSISVADTDGLDSFLPGDIRILRKRGREGDRSYYTWRLTWTLTPTRSAMVPVGRWEVQIDGVVVPMEIPVLSVLPVDAASSPPAGPEREGGMWAALFSREIPPHPPIVSEPVLIVRPRVSASGYRRIVFRIPGLTKARARRVRLVFPSGIRPVGGKIIEEVRLADLQREDVALIAVVREEALDALRDRPVSVHLDGRVFRVHADFSSENPSAAGESAP